MHYGPLRKWQSKRKSPFDWVKNFHLLIEKIARMDDPLMISIPKKSVLVVDDDPSIRGLIEQFLQHYFPWFIIQSCGSIHEARQLIDHSIFQIIITDYHLADGNGTELIPLLPTECIKLGISGNNLAEEERCKFDQFFQKPIIFPSLLSYLRKNNEVRYFNNIPD
jgi:DNA-binding NtrC family response regulator